MDKPVLNIGASVRARLKNMAKSSNTSVDLLLRRFVLERLLYRLSLSPYRDRFVLKGAMLVTTWFANPHRQTHDVDLLGFGSPDSTTILSVFREIMAMPANDGMAFDIAALRAEPIREEGEYGGLRLVTKAMLDGALPTVKIDIGFGDATEPGIDEIDLPTLLDLPSPRLRAYARETVIAEKFHVIVYRGRANSRLKDYYDIWLLSRMYQFSGNRLARAILATFERRKTALPVLLPDGLSAEFASDPVTLRQWAVFAADIAIEPNSFADVVNDLASFLMPHLAETRRLRSRYNASGSGSTESGSNG